MNPKTKNKPTSAFLLNLHKDEDGFTLIELMIVVVIIGILAAIAIPVFSNQQRASIDATVKSDTKSNTINMAPATGGKLYLPKATFQTRYAATSDNIVGYTVTPNQDAACTWTSHKYSDTDVTSYKFETSTGKTTEGTCPDLGGGSYVSNNTLIADWQAGGSGVPSGTSTTATCDNIILVVTGPATVTCSLASTTAKTSNYTVTVTGTSATPSIWSVQGDWTGVNNFAKAASWGTPITGVDPITTKTYTFSGTDRSWNADPAASNNYKYISSAKAPNIFTVQVTWN